MKIDQTAIVHKDGRDLSWQADGRNRKKKKGVIFSFQAANYQWTADMTGETPSVGQPFDLIKNKKLINNSRGRNWIPVEYILLNNVSNNIFPRRFLTVNMINLYTFFLFFFTLFARYADCNWI